MKPITLIEVGPRDGLQNEASFIQSADKIHFIDLLSASGLQEIEVTSFVSEKAIPQLADNQIVLEGIKKNPNVIYTALVPNLIGMEKAGKASLKKIAIFTAASEQFNQRNIHCSIDESIERFKPVIAQAQRENISVRAYISCVLGCPYEGSIKPAQVVHVTEKLLALGVDEISYGDTIGVGTPKQTKALIRAIKPLLDTNAIALHFHDTYGQAIANIYTALEENITRFDASTAGLGGCPYAQGATGNVAMEDVLYLMHGLGLETGIDIYKIVEAGDFICKKLGKRNQSKVANALLANVGDCR